MKALHKKVRFSHSRFFAPEEQDGHSEFFAPEEQDGHFEFFAPEEQDVYSSALISNSRSVRSGM